jgi:hypothetical protein
MSTHSPLGRCPSCESPIPQRRLLIEYETADGQAMFAECPDCRDVVHPR